MIKMYIKKGKMKTNVIKYIYVHDPRVRGWGQMFDGPVRFDWAIQPLYLKGRSRIRKVIDESDRLGGSD